MYLAGSHGDARLLTVGNDFLKAQLAVAENSDKSNKHGGPFLKEEYPVSAAMQSLCHHPCAAFFCPGGITRMRIIRTSSLALGAARRCEMLHNSRERSAIAEQ
jgi:hypothetical protein